MTAVRSVTCAVTPYAFSYQPVSLCGLYSDTRAFTEYVEICLYRFIACKAVALFFGGLLIKIIKNTGENGEKFPLLPSPFLSPPFSPVFFIILINNPPKNKATALQANRFR